MHLLNKKMVTALLLVLTMGCKSTSKLAATTAKEDHQKEESFGIAVLPDTQYYTALKHGGTMQMFENQINWIIGNQKKEHIAYVVHLGDITDHNVSEEWDRAKTVLYKLDAHDIPYGLSLGNHDETPNGNPPKGITNTDHTKYFGKDHFAKRPWYGGSMGNNNNNDNHFDLFTANGEDYLAMYFAFNQLDNKYYSAAYEQEVMHWADSVLTKYADRKAIMVTHSMLGHPKVTNSGFKGGDGNNDVYSDFTKQGAAIYNMAKHHANVFLMLGGHIAGEGFRKDEYNGHVIKTYLADYQSRQNAPYGGAKDRNGGNGLMRLMTFNKTKQTLDVSTFAPQADGSVVKEEDGDSQFSQALYQ